MIIDFHVHTFRARENDLCMYPCGPCLTAEQMKRQLRAAGIDHICGSVLSRDNTADFDALRRLNREALELARVLDGFYTPGFHIHPGYVRESLEEIEYMHRRGVNLVGELVPYMHAWGAFEEKNLFEIMEAANACGMACSYHTPFDYDCGALADRFPNMVFVAAHPGDRARVAEHIAIMKAHPNICLDLSGTGLHRFGVLRHLIDAVGPERILFGTDYPICNPRMYVQAVYGEELSEEERELIFHKNAERILKISAQKNRHEFAKSRL